MRIDKLRHVFGGSQITVTADYSACRAIKVQGAQPFIECAGSNPLNSFGKLLVTVFVGKTRVAWADLTVVKPFSAMPQAAAVRRVMLLNELPRSAYDKGVDVAMVEVALELDAKVAVRGYNIDGVSPLVIVTKVFVEPPARRCGISEYIHGHLADIVHVYTGYRPTIAVLNCGDFADESKISGMTDEAYKEILYAHYAQCGYETALGTAASAVSKYVMWRELW